MCVFRDKITSDSVREIRVFEIHILRDLSGVCKKLKFLSSLIRSKSDNKTEDWSFENAIISSKICNRFA